MPQTILVIDQGLEFGGSIVSAANLIRSIDPAKFRIVFVSATSEALIRQKLRERGQDIDVVIARKKVNYNNGTHLFSSLRKSSYRILQRIGVVLFSLTKLLANAPYMFTIARCIRKYKIDLVHLNKGIDDEVGLVCTLLSMPQVVYLRGHVPLSAPQRKFLLPAISRFFAVSAWAAQPGKRSSNASTNRHLQSNWRCFIASLWNPIRYPCRCPDGASKACRRGRRMIERAVGAPLRPVGSQQLM